ncbi:MAG: flagellar biosynthesis protein FlhF [Clostridiales bacterium]|nr:MAG: flagellar biosynthesis protein FlhF [Clostridiales bacterium]
MIIRNYLVNDMYEAMMKIKQDLGNNAVIVSKRNVRQKGFFGFFRRRLIEVTAATESLEIQGKGIRKRTDESEETKIAAEKMTQGIRDEVRELREIVKGLAEKPEREVRQKQVTDANKDLHDMLIEMDFNKKVIDDFDTYCSVKKIDREDVNRIVLYEFLKDRFNEKVKVDLPRGRTMVFVGPTGVGKTTTIAKIASSESLIHQKKVGLITIDTYRIGAVEQLRIYANILDIPIEVVANHEEMRRAMERLDDCDLILVDTTGRSHKNERQLDEMKKYLDDIEEKNVYCVASMTTKNSDFIRIVKSYECMDYDHFIFTKMDETQSYGNILNAFYFSEKPVSYISVGQVVPDDMKIATKELLFKYAWGESKI